MLVLNHRATPRLYSTAQDRSPSRMQTMPGKSLATSLRRKRRELNDMYYRTPFACASGSACQTTTIVTPSPRPVVSASVLLELARWCQQRLAITEEHRCHHAAPTRQSPPAHDAHAVVPDDTSLARVNAPAASLLIQLTRLLQHHVGQVTARESEVDDDNL